jgi:hypothetical protein
MPLRGKLANFKGKGVIMNTRKDISDEQNTSSDFFNAPLRKGKPTFQQIKKRMRDRFAKKEYAELKKDFSEYGLAKDDIGKFFEAEGEYFFRPALLGGINTDELSLFLEMVPSESLKKMMSKNDYKVLDLFFGGHATAERSRFHLSEEQRNRRIAKIILLFAIDQEAVESFVNKPNFIITPNLRHDFEIALEQFKGKCYKNSSIT